MTPTYYGGTKRNSRDSGHSDASVFGRILRLIGGCRDTQLLRRGIGRKFNGVHGEKR